MFAAKCGSCGRRVLLGPSSILGIENKPGCIQVEFRCICDAVGTWLTGR